ncbi:hypothetical protein KW805_01895 [Candidatus Pacearchaeota archaeon]|nr:hypothetical protein [Candidatus Pacearchaeota archaeon]
MDPLEKMFGRNAVEIERLPPPPNTPNSNTSLYSPVGATSTRFFGPFYIIHGNTGLNGGRNYTEIGIDFGAGRTFSIRYEKSRSVWDEDWPYG